MKTEQNEKLKLELLLGNISDPEMHATIYGKYNTSTIDLARAENVLLLNFYKENRIFADVGELDESIMNYPKLDYGNQKLRENVAAFLSSEWDEQISAENMFAVSGVSSALECLAFSLCNEGEKVLIPAPLWYGFSWSFVQRPKLKMIPFELEDGFELTEQDIKRALNKHPDAKVLVLTNPNNPIGTNYSKEQLETIYEAFLNHEDAEIPGGKRHIISDEIYACSQVHINDEGEGFTSALKLDAYKKYPNNIHLTWGLSKDFGLAGFRVGFVISKSVLVHDTLEGSRGIHSYAWLSPIGSVNPRILTKLFQLPSDGDSLSWAQKAMQEYRRLLQQRYNTVKSKLNEYDIKYLDGNSGAIFFMLDLREYLCFDPKTETSDVTETFKGLDETFYNYDDIRELNLLRYLADEAEVILIRGQQLYCREPGYFRLCYTTDNQIHVIEAIDRIGHALGKLKEKSGVMAIEYS